MKVKFKNLLMGYTGKADDSVIYFSPKLSKYIVRKAPKSFEHDGTRRFAQINKHIFALAPTEGFKNDLKAYLPKYNALPANRDKSILSWNFMYSKLMWNMHHIYHVDLSNVTRQQIPDLPCHTLATAIEAGLLPKVKGWEEFLEEF